MNPRQDTSPHDGARGAGLDEEAVLARLHAGRLEIEGRIPWSSNATYLVWCIDGRRRTRAVYKPAAGEQPLWDFAPGTLHRREVAAYVVSRALGWPLVPATVIRDGPLGRGAVQLFISHDPDDHFLAMAKPPRAQVERIVAFDVVINNADRKAGHILGDAEGRLWCIDHGVCFHEEHKLRTVVWELAGEPLPPEVARDLAAFSGGFDRTARELTPLLTKREIEALARRARALARAGRYPEASPDRREFPWPPV